MIGKIRGFSIAFVLTHSVPATADQADRKPSAQPDNVETVVVTARRRPEALGGVPVAITAFSGKELEDADARTLADLGQTVPNLTVQPLRGTNSSIAAYIRGVGQQDPVAGFESGVGIYIDDVYLDRPQGSLLDIYDVERIEVLRGPQGTLYGRNTIGGAIKYVTRGLADQPELVVKLSTGTYGEADVVATASLSLTDELKIGGTVARLSHGGYGHNLFQNGVDNYNQDVLAGRAAIEYAPRDDIFVRISGDYSDDMSDPRQGHRLIPGLLSPAQFPVLKNFYDSEADLDLPRDPVVVNSGVTGLFQWTASDTVTVKNILAYRNDYSRQQIDFDSLPVDDLQSPNLTSDHQLSEELQLLYDADGISGVAGVYYLNAQAFDAFDVLLGLTGQAIGLPGLNSFALGTVKTQTEAVYGDATFDLARLSGWSGLGGLALELGGRYTIDTRRAFVRRQTLLGDSTFFGGTPTVLATISNFNGSATFTAFTPRASLSWKPAPDQNVYISYSEGFKGGGFDPRGVSSATPDFNKDGIIEPSEIKRFMEFLPEKISTYEAGVKASLLGGRASGNLAVFYSDYTDVQIPGDVGVDTNGDGIADTFAGITTNAAKATIYGAEFEGRAVMDAALLTADDRFTATASAGYDHARFDRFTVATTDPVTNATSLQNVAGTTFFADTPEWTASAALAYSVALTMLGEAGVLSLTNAVSYRSLYRQFQFASPVDQPDFAIYDATLAWRSDDGTWLVGLFGKNLTDARYKIAGYDEITIPPPIGLEGTLSAFYGPPRTLTVTVERRF